MTAYEIVITTSDDYVFLLPGFAHQWNKYCGLPALVVYRNVAPPPLPSNLTPVASPARYFDWSGSLLGALGNISAPLVLLGLEDYWLSGPADIPAIQQAAEYMLVNPDVMRIDLTDDRTAYPHVMRDGYYQAVIDPAQVQYVLSTQFSLWRHEFLQRALRPGELGPQFEVEASRRIAHEHPVILGTGRRVLPCHGDGVIWNGRLDNLHTDYLSEADRTELHSEGLL